MCVVLLAVWARGISGRINCRRRKDQDAENRQSRRFLLFLSLWKQQQIIVKRNFEFKANLVIDDDLFD